MKGYLENCGRGGGVLVDETEGQAKWFQRLKRSWMSIINGEVVGIKAD